MTPPTPPTSKPERAEMREKLAEECWHADNVRITGKRRSVAWSEAGPAAHLQYSSYADAILALLNTRTTPTSSARF